MLLVSFSCAAPAQQPAGAVYRGRRTSVVAHSGSSEAPVVAVVLVRNLRAVTSHFIELP